MIVCIAGSTGTGKTLFLKNIIKNLNDKVYILDPQDEYNEKFLISKIIKVKYFETIYKLLNSDIQNTTFVIEEASMFFTHAEDRQIIRKLVSNRHDNNNFFFVFHSLRKIPNFIIDFIDYLILFQTNDQQQTILRKFNHNLLHIHKHVSKQGKYYYFILKRDLL